MATNTIQSSASPLEFSEDAGTTWLTAVCRKGNNFTLEVPTTEEETDCGRTVGLGIAKFGFDIDGTVNHTPGASEASFKKMLTWCNSKTALTVRQQAGTTGSYYYMSGVGYLTNLRATFATNNVVGYSATFLGDGALDITP